ncbi:MAG: flagellar motor switch protein FliY [Sulfuricurvum sp. PC08-66]|nr:MAG: flagellar motor switch protein FliY [Sulfuricurvum sp. PC08-66]
MEEFINLFIAETKATITGLTGGEPTIRQSGQTTQASESKAKPPVAFVYVEVTGAAKGKMVVAIPPQMATAVVDMMMAGEGTSKDEMNSDDLDGTKEFVANIVGALSTALGSHPGMPKLSMSAEKISFFDADDQIHVQDFGKEVNFAFKLGEIDATFSIILDASILGAMEGKVKATASESSSSVSIPSTKLEPDEMRNIALIMDVKLPVTVRIGSKRMLLKDVINMDIGSVIELNQLANDPLDILVDNHVIAQGEVVIVDGNFGIQITHIGTRRERLNQLKGA